MANPITGPFTANWHDNVVPGLHLTAKTATWYRQKRPYNQPLSYYARYRRTQKVCATPYLQADNVVGISSSYQAFRVDQSNGDWGNSYVNGLKGQVQNRAAEKIQNLLSDTASTLTALVEAQSTVNMVVKRMQSLAKFKSFFERKRYRDAIRTVLTSQKFSSRKKESLRKKRLMHLYRQPESYWKSKSVAQAWIETWFGWLPTIGDMQKSMEVLDRLPPAEFLKVRTHIDYAMTYDEFGRVSTHSGRMSCLAGCVIQVSNPNLFLASQLGLTNPILTAVEVLPWSWLLGWFVNLDQYFRQFSVFHGISVDRPWMTLKLRDFCKFDWYTFGPYQLYTQGEQECSSIQRSLGLPQVTLRWKGLNRLSVTRGATLASLLALRLPK